MRPGRLLGFSFLLLSIPCLALSHSRRGPTARRLTGRHASRISAHPLARLSSGQHTIDDQRATQIQAALVTAGYLPSETSGHWDSATEAAMQKFQADNGWQTKFTPDSRAIIKLGLGPAQTVQSSAASQQPASGPAL